MRRCGIRRMRILQPRRVRRCGISRMRILQPRRVRRCGIHRMRILQYAEFERAFSNTPDVHLANTPRVPMWHLPNVH